MKELIWIFLGFAILSCSRSDVPGWELPIMLGDSKPQIYEMLGAPSDTPAEDVHWFKNSGMTVRYDPSGRVSEVIVHGPWNSRVLTYSGPVISGVRVTDNLRDLIKALGEPSSSEEDDFGPDVRTYKWRRSPILIEATVFTEAYTENGRENAVDSIMSIAVSKAEGGE